MLKNIIKSVMNPKKAWRFIGFMLKYSLRKKSGVLLYIGMDPNGTFNLMYRGFEKCFGFEANPERFIKLSKKFKNKGNVYLFNVAVADHDGEVSFNISDNNNGASSSLGHFNQSWEDEKKIKMVKSITIPCINLLNFLTKENINYIDEYVSDIQGMDLAVLKTLTPLIQQKKIGQITCEVTKNEKKNIYTDLPDNSEKGFEELLNENYILVAKGWGALVDNVYDKIQENEWEMDCKWKSKTSS